MPVRSAGRPSPTVSVIALDDELSLFDTRTGTAMTLNRTASDIFHLLDGSSSTDDVVAVLARFYGVAPAEIRTDVESTVSDLTAAGVILRPEA
jgi:hypothetical protein